MKAVIKNIFQITKIINPMEGNNVGGLYNMEVINGILIIIKMVYDMVFNIVGGHLAVEINVILKIIKMVRSMVFNIIGLRMAHILLNIINLWHDH
jgi:hypothetical protein